MEANSLTLIWKSLPLFCQGIAVTAELFVLAAILSTLLGMGFGILTSKRFKLPLISEAIQTMTFALRAVPFFVQLLIIYFVVPEVLGCSLDPFPASVIALSLCSSGYVTQFIRGSIDDVPLSQWESATALGYSKAQTLKKIVLPQAFRTALPALNNELESLLKSTAVASSIGMLELTRIGMNVVSREMEPVPIYLAIALFYAALSVMLGWITKQLKQRFSYVKC